MQAPISEIFSSIQGEGKYVGCRQLFIRFVGCNLKCRYCDTESLLNTTHCDCEGKGLINNPVDFAEILPYLEKRLKKKHHSISLTGGEPLLHTDFINEIGQKIDCPLFLETNGTLCEQLQKVINNIDIISMDIKMPDAVGENLWEKHKKFLQIAAKKDVYVKIVIAQETKLDDFTKAIDLIESFNKNLLLILQPMTPYGGYTAPSPEKILIWQSLALEKINDVRVIGQTHRMIGQR
ncbi:7-carboxy-7-deazaguanine synthase QueE [Pectinatus sottacetonis]|uniref:7-carboxy-7-deazaguanine synthase QueE n=1 Tax=Pectinatus sottacetonis TaxID=1002795 RepID=UPI0018C699C5|nr:7-carboxy-7-deazaguanine synthase QueE [Pectinatus sottacetonis]